MINDPYKILGIKYGATKEEIQKAFRKFCKLHHPDAHPNASEEEKKKEAEIFKKGVEAYSQLTDNKDLKPDSFFDLENWFSSFSPFDIFTKHPFGDFSEEFTSEEEPEEEEKEIGDDIRINLTISLEDQIFGCAKEFKLREFETCSECGGLGFPVYAKCEKCHGTGKCTKRWNIGQIRFSTVSASCPICGGSGKDPKYSSVICKKCLGNRKIENLRKIQFVLPRGIYKGKTIVLKGEGSKGINGGNSGNLYITISDVVEDMKSILYHKHNYSYDLSIVRFISPLMASLGGEISVYSPYGEERKLRIPAGIKPGISIRMKKMGIKSDFEKNVVGDLFVILKISSYSNLSKIQKINLKEFEDSLSNENLPEIYNFETKMEIFRKLHEKKK